MERPRQLAGPLTLIALGLPLAAAAALRGGSLWSALTRLDLPLTMLAISAGAVSLVLRAEAWRHCVEAFGAPRLLLGAHVASALSSLAGLGSSYLCAPVRIAALRRIERERGPSAPQIALAEVPISLFEVSIYALLALILASSLGVPHWVAAAGLVGCVMVALCLRPIASKFDFARGLDIFSAPRRAFAAWALIAGYLGFQVLRNWLLLEALRMNAGFKEAALLLLAGKLFALLPLAPGSAAASLYVLFGTSGANASLALMAVSAGAGLAYALGCALWVVAQLVHTLQDRRHSTAAHEKTAVDPALLLEAGRLG